MSKVLLHFVTVLGGRTIVAEVGDAATAQAVVNSHLALGQNASVVEEMPRISIKDHMAKHTEAMVKAKKKAAKLALVSVTPSNVTPLRKGRAR